MQGFTVTFEVSSGNAELSFCLGGISQMNVRLALLLFVQPQTHQ